jgi:hypothetical protein
LAPPRVGADNEAVEVPVLVTVTERLALSLNATDPKSRESEDTDSSVGTVEEQPERGIVSAVHRAETRSRRLVFKVSSVA